MSGEVAVGPEVPGAGDGALCLTRHCHHVNDFGNKMGIKETHFNVLFRREGKLNRKDCLSKTRTFEDTVYKTELLKRKVLSTDQNA